MSGGGRQLKNACIYLAPPLIGNALSLLSLMVLARYVSTADFGAWALAQAYAFFVVGIANVGLNIGYERNFFEHSSPGGSAGLLYSTLALVLGILVVFGAATMICGPAIAAVITGMPRDANLIFWAYCAAAVASLKAYYLIYLKNIEDAKSFAWYTIDENILGTAFALALVAYFQVGIIGLVWGQLFAGVLVLAVLVVKAAGSMPVRFDAPALWACLRISLPLTPRILFGAIGSHFDKYMLRLLDSIGGAGIYSIGQRISNVVFVFMTAIQNVYSPQVYKKMFGLGPEAGSAIGTYLTPFLYASVASGLLMALFAEEVVTVLMPASYLDAIDVIMIMSMLYVSYFFGKQPHLTFAKKAWLTSALTLFGIVLNVAINVPLIRSWGALGAAWGTFVAGMITSAVTFFVSQRYCNIQWEYAKILPMLALFFASVIALILMRRYELPYTVRLPVKLAVIAGFAYAGFSSGVLRRGGIASLLSAFQR